MGHVDSVVFFLWKFFIRVTQVTWVTPVTFDTFEPYHEPHMLRSFSGHFYALWLQGKHSEKYTIAFPSFASLFVRFPLAWVVRVLCAIVL